MIPFSRSLLHPIVIWKNIYVRPVFPVCLQVAFIADFYRPHLLTKNHLVDQVTKFWKRNDEKQNEMRSNIDFIFFKQLNFLFENE